MGEIGFFGLIHLALWVYAAVQILDSPAPTANKVLWVLIVALLPVIGLIAWFLLGPGTPKK